MSDVSQFDQEAVCESCGRFGAFDFGGKHLCVDCYEGGCSCCPEFGADDLWPVEEPPVQKEAHKVPERVNR